MSAPLRFRAASQPPVPLRPVTQRPEVIVDDQGLQIVEPLPGTPYFFPPAVNPALYNGPGFNFFNLRVRLVYALPLKDGPRQITPHVAIADSELGYLGDPDGNLVGVQGAWCARLIQATNNQNTLGVA